MKIRNEKGSGSLPVGTSAGSHVWARGQWFRITGESFPRQVTFVMGSGETTQVCTKGSGPFPKGDLEYEIVTAPHPPRVVAAADVTVSLASTGSVVGIDVGYSDDEATTGFCQLDWTESEVTWAMRNTKRSLTDREKALAALNSRQRRIRAVAVDGPLVPNLAKCTRYRAAEAILSQGVLQKRGKPGQTNAGSGPQLHAEATELAKLALHVLQVDEATHAGRICGPAIVEAFPNMFLGTLCDESNYPQAPGKKRKWTDTLFPLQDVSAKLRMLVATLLPGREVRSPWGLTDHEEIAALTCALTALCVAADHFTAVGDDRDGYIFLAPSWAMGVGWPVRLEECRVACLRDFPSAKIVWRTGDAQVDAETAR